MSRIIKSADFEQRVKHLMHKAVLPGVSICTIRDGKIDHSIAFGVADADTQLPLDNSSILEAASLGKPVFAYAVMKLCQQGMLSLDQPLSSYLSKGCLQNVEAVAGLENNELMHRVTARQVLSHSSGFPNWPTPGTLLACESEPGERFNYSSAGFNYLQYVVEQVTAQPCDELMKSLVFEPLGMTSSSYTNRLLSDQDSGKLIAQGHNAQGAVVPREQWQSMIASSSLLCTPSDYALFLMQMIKQQNVKGSTAEQMIASELQVDGMPVAAWGLGWGLQTEPAAPIYWHWGDNQIFTSMALVEQQTGNGIVLVANAARGFEVFRAIITQAMERPSDYYPVITGLEAIYGIEAIGV